MNKACQQAAHGECRLYMTQLHHTVDNNADSLMEDTVRRGCLPCAPVGIKAEGKALSWPPNALVMALWFTGALCADTGDCAGPQPGALDCC